MYKDYTTGVANTYGEGKLSEHCDAGPVVAILELILSAGNRAGDTVSVRSDTNFASPIVAGIKSIYVSFEHLSDDVGKVRDRLTRNALSGYIANVPQDTVNLFVQSGIHSPHKADQVPYDWAPSQELADGNDPKPVGGGGGPIVHRTTPLPVPAATGMALPTGQVNAFKGDLVKWQHFADTGLIPSCHDVNIPKVNATKLVVFFTAGILFQAEMPKMPDNCKRRDGTAFDITDYAGCVNIPGALDGESAFDICGSYGLQLPRADVVAAMGALIEKCTVNDKVDGEVQFGSGISFRL